MGKYDDIIHTPWPRPTKRARMSLEDRAAQFAPLCSPDRLRRSPGRDGAADPEPPCS